MSSKPPATLQPISTLGAPPAPKDVPWWGAIILALLSTIVGVLGTIYAMRPNPAGVATPPGFGALLTDSITFLPHILILFGILADIFTLQGAYSIPSLVGLCSIPINFGLKFFWDGLATLLAEAFKIVTTKPVFTPIVTPAVDLMKGGAVTGWDGCEIKGFEFLSSGYAPQGLVVTATVFWYYLLDLLMNRDPLDSSVTWVAFILFFGLQAMQLKSCSNMAGSFFIKTFISLAEGFIIGGLGYGIVAATIPTRLPSAVLPQGPNISSLTKQADGTYRDAGGKEYIVGPDGRPMEKSFLEAAAAHAAPAVQPTCSGS